MPFIVDLVQTTQCFLGSSSALCIETSSLSFIPSEKLAIIIFDSDVAHNKAQ